MSFISRFLYYFITISTLTFALSVLLDQGYFWALQNANLPSWAPTAYPFAMTIVLLIAVFLFSYLAYWWLQIFTKIRAPQAAELRLFRKRFLEATADGKYPQERQQKLYQLAMGLGLNWQDARSSVQKDAKRFLDKHKPDYTTEEFSKLKRRLGLDPDQLKATKQDSRALNVAIAVSPTEHLPHARSANTPTVRVAPKPVGFELPQTANAAQLAVLLREGVTAMNPSAFRDLVAQTLRSHFEWKNVQTKQDQIKGTHRGERCIAVCKHYYNKIVPAEEVAALIAIKHAQGYDKAYFITSGSFDPRCYDYATGVELWDIDTFAAHIKSKQLGFG